MRTLLFLCSVVFAYWPAFAQRPSATVVYSQYFTSYGADSTPPDITVAGGATVARSPNGFRLLGPFSGKQALTLRLHDLPLHRRLTIRIGVHLIGPWRGNTGKESFSLNVDARRVFSETFSNTIEPQSYPGRTKGRAYPPRTGARNNNMLGYRYQQRGVYDGVMDATYEHAITIDHTDSMATIVLSSRTAASWGLEHLVIELEGGEQPSDIFPARRLTAPSPDEEIIAFTGRDVRALGVYNQDDDLPGIVVGGAWDRKTHRTMFHTRCNSCGSICMMYTYIFYTDGWVNVWSNREPYGPALFSCVISPSEFAAIQQLLVTGMRAAEQDSYQAPDLENLASVEHCTLRMIVAGKERVLSTEGGEPAAITNLTTKALEILKRYGWWPTPFIQE